MGCCNTNRRKPEDYMWEWSEAFMRECPSCNNQEDDNRILCSKCGGYLSLPSELQVKKIYYKSSVKSFVFGLSSFLVQIIMSIYFLYASLFFTVAASPFKGQLGTGFIKDLILSKCIKLGLWFIIPLFLSVLGIVFGKDTISTLSRQKGKYKGKSFTISGIILSTLSFLIFVSTITFLIYNLVKANVI